jgi:hypothetical protein
VGLRSDLGGIPLHYRLAKDSDMAGSILVEDLQELTEQSAVIVHTFQQVGKIDFCLVSIWTCGFMLSPVLGAVIPARCCSAARRSDAHKMMVCVGRPAFSVREAVVFAAWKGCVDQKHRLHRP